MPAFTLHVGPNIRRSPYYEATVADGVASFSVYNHMLIPGSFGDPQAEYARLIDGVVMWDVAAQRQVEIAGPDAERLIRRLTPRDLTGLAAGRGRYVPICDDEGLLINDPVLLKLADDRFWLSVADSDVELWARGQALALGLDVRVFEAEAAPLAIQGPKAFDVAADLLGAWVRDLKRFEFRPADVEGIELLVMRAGWSKQGGVELYLLDPARGGALWDAVRAAGAPYGIIPGAPNDWERIEGGLLSYGADARRPEQAADPFELGLGALVDLERADDFVGKAALIARKAAGLSRRRVGFLIDGPADDDAGPHPLIDAAGAPAGTLWEHCASPRFGRTIGVGLAATAALAHPGGLRVAFPDGPRAATPCAPDFSDAAHL